MKDFLFDSWLIAKGFIILIAGMFLIGVITGGVDRFWAWVFRNRKDKSEG